MYVVVNTASGPFWRGAIPLPESLDFYLIGDQTHTTLDRALRARDEAREEYGNTEIEVFRLSPVKDQTGHVYETACEMCGHNPVKLVSARIDLGEGVEVWPDGFDLTDGRALGKVVCPVCTYRGDLRRLRDDRFTICVPYDEALDWSTTHEDVVREALVNVALDRMRLAYPDRNLLEWVGHVELDDLGYHVILELERGE